MAIVYPPVSLIETVISAGAPNTLQKTVAFISYGATTLAVESRTLVTKLSDITGSLPGGSWLLAAFTTFFAQGNSAAFVIELGTTGSNVTAQATASLQHQVATIAVHSGGGGSGWTVSETFSFAGGTGHVSTVSSGVVTGVVLDTHPGQVSDPAGSAIVATATSGSGTGLTLDVTSSLTGALNPLTITVPGVGYFSAPSVVISGGGGVATAQATVSGGAVTVLTILTDNDAYTSVPTVTISPPPANLSQQLQTYITSFPLQNYLYVIDPTSSQDAGIQTLVAVYNGLQSYTYFLLTLNVAQATTFADNKAGIVFIPSLSAPATEFGAAVIAFAFASLTPSLAAKIMPFNFRFAVGVTPYADPSSPLLQPALQTDANLIIPATAGGLTNNMLLGGQTSDGNAINLWYGPDYASITVTQALTNEIINGSNNSLNPLVYDQQGVNRLAARALQALNAAVAVGAILGPVTVTATSFAAYVLAFPSDYQSGTYNGLSFTIIPARGFNSLTYSLLVDFTAASVVVTSQ